METSAGKISRLRRKAKLSEQEAATRLGITVETLRRWEAGKQCPKPARLVWVCDTLRGLVPKQDPGTPPLPPPTGPAPKRLHNVIAIVIDKSSSMQPFSTLVVDQYQKTLVRLRREALTSGQRTDVVTVLFGDRPEPGPMINNIGVYSENMLASQPLNYHTSGMTALRDGVLTAINLAYSLMVPKAAETSYVIQVITDGYENKSINTAETFTATLRRLQATDEWTFAFQLPSAKSLDDFCANSGVPRGNCMVWKQTESGLREASHSTQSAYSSFFQGRSLGARSSKSFYTDLSQKSATEVSRALQKMDDISHRCAVISVPRDATIRDVVESKGVPYTAGCAYYQLVKTEAAVQDYKGIIITKVGGAGIFHGRQARQLLGLPLIGTARVVPGDHSGYDIYIQSTSFNRRIPAGTKVIYYQP